MTMMMTEMTGAYGDPVLNALDGAGPGYCKLGGSPVDRGMVRLFLLDASRRYGRDWEPKPPIHRDAVAWWIERNGGWAAMEDDDEWAPPVPFWARVFIDRVAVQGCGTLPYVRTYIYPSSGFDGRCIDPGPVMAADDAGAEAYCRMLGSSGVIMPPTTDPVTGRRQPEAPTFPERLVIDRIGAMSVIDYGDGPVGPPVTMTERAAVDVPLWLMGIGDDRMLDAVMRAIYGTVPVGTDATATRDARMASTPSRHARPTVPRTPMPGATDDGVWPRVSDGGDGTTLGPIMERVLGTTPPDCRGCHRLLIHAIRCCLTNSTKCLTAMGTRPDDAPANRLGGACTGHATQPENGPGRGEWAAFTLSIDAILDKYREEAKDMHGARPIPLELAIEDITSAMDDYRP